MLAGGIEDTHKGIPAVPALDFSRQPCMGGFPGRLDFHVVHQLLAAGQPDVGGNNALMGEPVPAFGLSSRSFCWASHLRP